MSIWISGYSALKRGNAGASADFLSGILAARSALARVLVGLDVGPVVVIGRRGAPLARGRLRPGVRIQHEFVVGIVAMAIQVLEEQRLAGYAASS